MHNGMTYVLQIGMTSNIGGMETYLIEQYKNINKKQINYDFLTLFDDEKIAFCEYIHSNGGNIFCGSEKEESIKTLQDSC